MPNDPDRPLSIPYKNVKNLAAEFTKLIESGVELDEKSARELLNNILSSK